ncbi:MAG: D-aminoacyl-tRNA deacylase [Spirochaetaceae bacterium]|jgi:D-tyrosyl-tRNA(Tyr) deacylase|nr:D-aminoacyl-tRNA deacylase [Spirochaetaceae bacterium]
MRAIIQRVKKASVEINHDETRKIGPGLMVLLGIHDTDSQEDILWLSKKILQLRIFNDGQGKMNLSLEDIKGQLMVISQFTLYASTKKGKRPSFNGAALPDKAIPLYQDFLYHCKTFQNQPVVSGEFGAHMEISLINDGPVTIIMDSKNRE